ncbi:hypothetical protein [Nonomuraea dietziae]|uniref:hypothetical protein n=1 Tax=Nonomuraea dietziae TaxID=65515 RepID=UPI0031DFF09B
MGGQAPRPGVRPSLPLSRRIRRASTVTAPRQSSAPRLRDRRVVDGPPAVLPLQALQPVEVGGHRLGREQPA